MASSKAYITDCNLVAHHICLSVKVYKLLLKINSHIEKIMEFLLCETDSCTLLLTAFGHVMSIWQHLMRK